jgi:hypothetical protein
MFSKAVSLLNNNQASVMGLPIVGLQIRDNWGV